ncbi:MAG: hypothetical protein ACJ77D_09380 [Chloroflexota bacterium]
MPPRVVAVFAWLAAFLPLMALVVFLAAYRFDVGRLADLPSIVGDRASSGTLRLAGLLDMSAYLPVALVALYLHRRLQARGGELMGIFTFGGLAYVVLGSLGGAIVATVLPPLVEDGSEIALTTFAAFSTLVTVTIWSTLELIFLGTWLIGIGWLVRAERAAFGNVAVIAGVGALLTAVRSAITGRSVGDLPGVIDFLVVGLLGLYVPWLAWLGLRLYRER